MYLLYISCSHAHKFSKEFYFVDRDDFLFTWLVLKNILVYIAFVVLQFDLVNTDMVYLISFEGYAISTAPAKYIANIRRYFG